MIYPIARIRSTWLRRAMLVIHLPFVTVVCLAIVAEGAARDFWDEIMSTTRNAWRGP